MKKTALFAISVLALSASAVTYHRSFRNGYPVGAGMGVGVRAQPNAAVLKAPLRNAGGTKVVTNRVVLTREQAKKLMEKKGIKPQKTSGRPAKPAARSSSVGM